MLNNKNSAIRELNNLVETCLDGEKGFRLAAAEVRDMNLRDLFLRYADQRARFASDLSAAVRRLGGEPSTGGSLKATMFRGLLRAKNGIMGTDQHRVVQWAEAGEDRALDRYQRALEAELPGDVRDLVQQQMEGVSEAHAAVRELERRDEAIAEARQATEEVKDAADSIPTSPGGILGIGPGGSPGHQV